MDTINDTHADDYADAIREELRKRKQELEDHKLAIAQHQRDYAITAEVVASIERILRSMNLPSKAVGSGSTKPDSAATHIITLLRDGTFRNNEEIRRDLEVGNETKIINRYRTAVYHLRKRNMLIRRDSDGRFGLSQPVVH